MFELTDRGRDVRDATVSELFAEPASVRAARALTALPLPHAEFPDDRVGRAEPPLRRRLVSLDAFVVTMAWITAWVVTRSATPTIRFVPFVLETVLAVGSTIAVLALLHLYRARVCVMRRIARRRLVLAAFVAPMVAWAYDLRINESASAARFFGSGIAVALGLIVGREVFEQWLGASRVRGRYFRPVVVVGSVDEVERMVALFVAHPETGCKVVGWVGAPGGPNENPAMAAVPWLGITERAAAVLELTGVESVVVAPSVTARPDFHQLVNAWQTSGTHVQLWTGLWSIDTRRLRAAPMAHEPFFYLEPAGLASGTRLIKRGLDFVVAAVVLLLTSPVLALAALAIKLGDGGPVFFRQVRVGHRGATFRLHKFRTMSVDAERRLAELEGQNERSGPLFKVSHDPRVTKVGRLLRATSIDELPQLIDVLTGKLSLVGPRPALPDEVAEFDDELLQRHNVLPGVTGLWQVEARHNPSFEAYRRLDLFYVKNWTLTLDLVLMLATVKTVLTDTVRGLTEAIGHKFRRRRASVDALAEAR